ncbi:HlyD family efflux transporter periplasmic adaptor subunit [Lachnospiraceae bacterium 48-42]|nr:hypothetical protein [Dorea sp.]
MDRKKKWAVRLCAGFFAIMVLATVLSRMAASILVAEVETGRVQSGRLSYSCDGEGCVAPVRTELTFLWEGQQVEKAAKPGTFVKKGECLVQFRMEYLKEQIEKKEDEITQLELQASQQQVSARESARVPQTVGASRTLEDARQMLNDALKKEEAAKKALADENAASGSSSRARSQAAGSEAQKGENQEAETRKQEGEKPAAEGGKQEGRKTAAEGGKQEGEKPVAEARKQEGESPAAETRKQEESLAAETGSQMELNQAAESAKQQKMQELEASLSEAEQGVEDARQALNQAQNAYDLACQEDAAQDLNSANQAEASRLSAEAAQLQVVTAKKALQKLKKYEAAEGKIRAKRDCVVLSSGVQPGTITAGTEVFETGSGGFCLRGSVKTTDQEKLKTGAEVSVQLPSGAKKSAVLEAITSEPARGGSQETNGTGSDQGEEDSSPGLFWYAPLPDNTEVKGTETFTWNTESASEKEYEQIIPLSALREDVSEAYCLIVSEEKHMLGTIQTAKRVPVTVLEKDGEKAAVTSILREEDKLITASEKYVQEGDRVRIKE